MSIIWGKGGLLQFLPRAKKTRAPKCLCTAKDKQKFHKCPFLWTWKIIWKVRMRLRAEAKRTWIVTRTAVKLGIAGLFVCMPRAERAESHCGDFAVWLEIVAVTCMSLKDCWDLTARPSHHKSCVFFSLDRISSQRSRCLWQVALNSFTKLVKPHLFTRQDATQKLISSSKVHAKCLPSGQPHLESCACPSLLSLLGPMANNIIRSVNHCAWISLLEILFRPLFFSY